MEKRVIILGAGQAGVQVATSLRQGGYDGQIMMAGKESHVPYQRPPLSKQVLKNEWAGERCQFRHLEFYQQHDIDLHLGLAATKLDPRERRVHFQDGSTAQYQALAICTGSRLNQLRAKGTDLAGVCYLRNLDDALALSARLKAGARVVVIGGGYIGLEVASAARSLGCEVTVVEALEAVLKRSALPEIADHLFQRHLAEGVKFLMGRKVSALLGSGHVEAVALEEGDKVPADVVMIGVGVQPDLAWLDGAGLETQRGIRVGADCRSNVEDIFAAGDVAELRHPLLEGWHVLESVQNAVSQGKVIAANILGQSASYTDVPWFWSDQFDCKLQMAGIPRSGDVTIRRENPETGGFSVFGLTNGRISAVQCINSPRDYMVGRQLISHAVEIEARVLSDSQFSLKDLL